MQPAGITACLLIAVAWCHGSVSADPVTTRIGPFAVASDVSHQASIWLKVPSTANMPRTFGCSGAIIGRNFVITSATCVDSYSADRIEVGMATNDLTDTSSFTDVIRKAVNVDNDLVLLQLSSDGFFPDTSIMELIQGQMSTGDGCTISGWNSESQQWEEQDVTYMSRESCAEEYNTLGATVEEKYVCATTAVGHTACTESLGWMLSCKGQLTGLFSWTHFGCTSPSVYSSIEQSMAWISEAKGSASSYRVSVVMLVAMLTSLVYSS